MNQQVRQLILRTTTHIVSTGAESTPTLWPHCVDFGLFTNAVPCSRHRKNTLTLGRGPISIVICMLVVCYYYVCRCAVIDHGLASLCPRLMSVWLSLSLQGGLFRAVANANKVRTRKHSALQRKSFVHAGSVSSVRASCSLHCLIWFGANVAFALIA